MYIFRIQQSKRALRTLIISALIFSTLSACSNLRFPGVYKIDIAQGNIVTQDLLDKLQPGMTQNQVKYILGSPLVEDTFNEDRWDYYYTLKTGRTNLTKSSQVTVFFEQERYTNYELIGTIRQSSLRREPLPKQAERKKFLWIF